MTTQAVAYGRPAPFSATGSPGILANVNLIGFAVHDTSSGSVKVEDSTGILFNTTTVAVGQFYRIPCRTTGQVTITITGTIVATMYYGS